MEKSDDEERGQGENGKGRYGGGRELVYQVGFVAKTTLSMKGLIF